MSSGLANKKLRYVNVPARSYYARRQIKCHNVTTKIACHDVPAVMTDNKETIQISSYDEVKPISLLGADIIHIDDHT